jgi:hypothetical protein
MLKMVPREPLRAVTVPGTWGDNDSWHRPGSWWWLTMAINGWLPAESSVAPCDGFSWSCDLDGALLDRLTGRRHTQWKAAGDALSYYLAGMPYEHRIVVAHSHGAQVLGYMLAEHGDHVPVRALITVCSPVREDMADVWAQGARYAHRWLHLYGPGWANKMQWAGTLFSGRLGFPAEMPHASENWALPPKAGHSEILREGKLPIAEAVAVWKQVDAWVRRGTR